MTDGLRALSSLGILSDLDMESMQTLVDLAKDFYTTYNASGSDPAFINKNFKGDPSPNWEDLPENVREKWIGVAGRAIQKKLEM